MQQQTCCRWCHSCLMARQLPTTSPVSAFLQLSTKRRSSSSAGQSAQHIAHNNLLGCFCPSVLQVVATSGPCLSPWQGPKWVVAAACLTLKGGRADWLVEKATELGAFALLPLVTERSHTGTTKSKFKSLSSKGSKAAAAEECPEDFQPSRLQRLALAATKQSLRAHALQLLPVTALSDLLPQLQQSPVSLVATAGAPPALHVLQEAAQQWQQSQQQPGCGAGALWWVGRTDTRSS